ARKQRVLANRVDQPWNSPRMAKHSLDRWPGKNLAGCRCSRNPKTAAHVLPGFVRIERVEMAAQRDPLFELPEFMGIEFLIEFRLTRQHDLQQFLLRGFQVRQKSNLFQ